MFRLLRTKQDAVGVQARGKDHVQYPVPDTLVQLTKLIRHLAGVEAAGDGAVLLALHDGLERPVERIVEPVERGCHRLVERIVRPGKPRCRQEGGPAGRRGTGSLISGARALAQRGRPAESLSWGVGRRAQQEQVA